MLKQAIKSGQDRTQTQAESDKWTSAATLAGASTSTGGLVWPAVFPCASRVTDVSALVYCVFFTSALHIWLSTIDLVLSAHPAQATTILSIRTSAPHIPGSPTIWASLQPVRRGASSPFAYRAAMAYNELCGLVIHHP
jgi:hypothetical protein